MESELEKRPDIKLGDPNKFIEIMKNRKSNFDRISKENWESRKKEYPFIPYFKKLRDELELEYRSKRYGKRYLDPELKIDPKEFYKNFKEVWEKKMIIWSSDPDDWIPIDITTILQWVKGNTFVFAEYNNLGIALIRSGRRNLLTILAKSGDPKAKMKKIRNKFPKELRGQNLKWIKLDEKNWLVEISNEIETDCKYDKIYEEYKDLWE